MNAFLSLTSLSAAARPDDWPVALSQDQCSTISWRDFIYTIGLVRGEIRPRQEPVWELYAEDHALFLIGLIALLQCEKEIHLRNSLPSQETTGAVRTPLVSDIVPNATVVLAPPAQKKGGPADECPAISPNHFKLFFHTSGSTGAPKIVAKSLGQVEAELKNLSSLWQSQFQDATVFSTVSSQHFYGFLFAGLLPFCTGSRLASGRIRYPESLIHTGKNESIIVTSPAFLKRIASGDLLVPRERPPRLIFSSGGFLPDECAKKNRSWFGTDITEIYGSTETGGIAWRRSPGDTPWTPFPGISLELSAGSTLKISSPYLNTPGSSVIEDRVEFNGDSRFRLLGRADSIVKIEEKRIALNEVENRISETALVEDVVVTALEEGRQYLAAVLVLNAAGESKFTNSPKIEINNFFKNFLRQYFDPVVIPRRWRFIKSIPRDAQGKISARVRRELFEHLSETISEPLMKVLRREDDQAVLELNFPADYIHFDGHFKELKVLPAVAQIDWAIKFTSSLLGVRAAIREIPVFKLMRPIFPDRPVLLEIRMQREKEELHFSFKDPESGKPYSKGKVRLEPAK